MAIFELYTWDNDLQKPYLRPYHVPPTSKWQPTNPKTWIHTIHPRHEKTTRPFHLEIENILAEIRKVEPRDKGGRILLADRLKAAEGERREHLGMLEKVVLNRWSTDTWLDMRYSRERFEGTGVGGYMESLIGKMKKEKVG